MPTATIHSGILGGKVMGKRSVDPTIGKFVANLTYIALLTFFILAALGLLGIQTT